MFSVNYIAGETVIQQGEPVGLFHVPTVFVGLVHF